MAGRYSPYGASPGLSEQDLSSLLMAANAANAAKGGGKGKIEDDKSQDWMCPGCGDRNFAKRVQCRKCSAENPNVLMPDMTRPGFKTAMCTFFQAGRCTKGQYCTYAHGEQEMELGRQMQEVSIAAPALHEAPFEVQNFLRGLQIKELPLKQFLAMSPEHQSLVMQRGPLVDARDPTAVLISRIALVRKVQNFQTKQANAGNQLAMQYGAQAAMATQSDPQQMLAMLQPSFEVVFQPGQLGIRADWSTGEVQTVLDGGQGQNLGVTVGSYFTQVNGMAYTEQLLDAVRATGQPFTVSFSLSPQDLASVK
eukprot:TRINITY_DN28324_c0_g1_i1.p1 TRINITY_DN28324_c0_g1~~TRINITY_DN28324_c0_g1_i1.p1  ORF type:complete len:309 (-),score=53.44 TRINITY_DN28324_c0_g1_i1:259-1185(-)